MKRFNLSLVVCLFLLSQTNAQGIHPRLDTAPNDPNGAIVHYDPANGNFRVAQSADATRQMTTLEIISESGVFDGPERCPVIGLFDVNSANKVFKLDPAGFSEHDCGQALQPGISLEFLSNDLTVAGSLVGGGPIPDVVLLVPEPSAGVLLLLGIGFFAMGRRRAFHA